MSWRDRLTWAQIDSQQIKRASFREATFLVRGSDYSLGRRNIVHRYPQKDIPFVEDNGRDTDEFSITGYVVQNVENDFDYIDERDALINALRQKGPGKLIHPFYGELQVSLVGRPNISEVFNRGGIARFTLNFVRVAESQLKVIFPKQKPDPKSSVDEAAEKAKNDSIDGMASINKSSTTPPPPTVTGRTPLTSGFVNQAVNDAVDSLKGMLRKVTMGIQGAFPTQIGQAINILLEEHADIDLNAIQDACALGNGVIGMFNGLLSLSGQFGDIVSGQLLGACSGTVRGLNSGPWSGAEAGFDPNAARIILSPLDKPQLESEDYGKSLISALLEVNKFGETTGSSNASSFGGIIDAIEINTKERAKQSANIVSVVNIARNTAIILAGQTAVRVKYNSYDSAIETMDSVVTEINNQLLKLGNDSADTNYDSYGVTISDPLSYNALVDFRPVFVEAMKTIGADLARIVDFEVPPRTMSTLELAYKLYEDLDREKEIIARNVSLITHPGFMPGGQIIEVLDE
jgi:prophage DNA circulation protein